MLGILNATSPDKGTELCLQVPFYLQERNHKNENRSKLDEHGYVATRKNSKN